MIQKQQEFISLLKKYNQFHIIKYLENLTPEEKKDILETADCLNFKLVFELYEQFSSGKNISFRGYEKITSPVIFNPTDRSKTQDLCNVGKLSIKKGEVAVTIAAGGQATRLGYPYPKGLYPISPVKGKSLFMLFCEKIKALSSKYDVDIPFLIMTNPENNKQIKDFFEKNNFWGLNDKNVFFFNQELLPSVTPEGKIILKEDGHFLANPDGHGGTLKSIFKTGLLQQMEHRGVKRIFYCHIDNPLVKIIDPVFLGYHITTEADFSLKTVKKKPGEKVGTFVYADGKATVIEYIELAEILKKNKNAREKLLFNNGSIGIHIINTEFIRNINKDGFALPYHRQKKTLSIGNKEIEVWKFETFIFDAIPFAKKVSCMETKREEEFAPLKNKQGQDSPSDVKRKMSELYKKWLATAGINVPDNVTVEISPLFACCEKEFVRKIKKRKVIIQKEIYIE